MASSIGGKGVVVSERSERHPRSYEFGAAIGLMAGLSRRFGRSLSEVRFEADHDMSYPASSVEILEIPDETRLGRVRVSVFGLTGAMGVLPLIYTDLVHERQFETFLHGTTRLPSTAVENSRPDRALEDFLTLLIQRLVCLLANAHLIHRLALQETASGSSAIRGILYDLLGLTDEKSRRRTGLGDDAILYYAPLLLMRPMPAICLVAMLSDYFDVPVVIDQYIVDWLDVPETECMRLGQPEGGYLGEDAMLGDRVLDPESAVCFTIGPISVSRAAGFFPGGRSARAFCKVARYGLGAAKRFSYVVEIGDEPPAAWLGGEEDGFQRLGRSLWLHSSDPGEVHVSGPYGPDQVMSEEED